MYFTRYNYDRPYMVVIKHGKGPQKNGSTVDVYEKKKNTLSHTHTDKDGPQSSEYTKKVKTFQHVKQVWIGKSQACEFTTGVSSQSSFWWNNTKSSPIKIQNEYTGNTILVHIGKKKYVQIGATIETFTFNENIESYWSPISHKGDIPQPLIVGQTVVCFADVEDIQEVNKDLFPKDIIWCNAPLYYLGERVGLPLDKRKYK